MSLDYDPYVSREHATSEAEGSTVSILDNPANRNGTGVNGMGIPPGEPT